MDINDNPLPYPIIFEVTERHTKKGQTLLFPEYQIDTYWCSIEQLPPEEVIRLYHDHGTSEQFHSELKSDMGLERLPSGHFSSNSLILHLAMLTYNMLRIIGQISLECVFRRKVTTHSAGNCPVIPLHCDHPFRNKLSTDSGTL